MMLAFSFAISFAFSVQSTPSASITSDVHIVMDWNKDNCGSINNTKLPPMPSSFCALAPSRSGCDDDNIDSMPRVFFDQLSGIYRQLHNVATVQGPSRPQIGDSLETMKHTCKAYTTMQLEDHVLNHFSDHVWVEAPYVLNKTHVYGLTHVDSYDPAQPQVAYSSLTLQISTDGGASFRQAFPAPHHLVATSPYDHSAAQFNTTRGIGLGMPSSILKDPRSDYLYVMALANWGQKVGEQEGGQCLLRTNDITDPGSWRAWNGTDFSVSVNVSAEVAPVPDPDTHTCAVLSSMPLRHISLLWSTYFEKYLAFGQLGGSWAFALSDDLITWSKPTVVEKLQGNGTITAASPAPGKWVLAPEGDAHAGAPYWVGAPNATGQEGQSGTVYKFKPWFKGLLCNTCKAGPCEPAPGTGLGDVCKLATNMSSAEWVSLPEATVHFSYALVSKLTGYGDYLYPTLVDDSEHKKTGKDPSFNVVGQTATLFAVANKCAGTTVKTIGTGTQKMVVCDMVDAVKHDRRDVVRVTIKFQK